MPGSQVLRWPKKHGTPSMNMRTGPTATSTCRKACKVRSALPPRSTRWAQTLTKNQRPCSQISVGNLDKFRQLWTAKGLPQEASESKQPTKSKSEPSEAVGTPPACSRKSRTSSASKRMRVRKTSGKASSVASQCSCSFRHHTFPVATTP